MTTITERIDRITEIAEPWRGTIIPVPRSVKIELTGRCNFSCAFCARSAKLRDQQDMNKMLFQRLLKEMRSVGVEEIGLFYLGESFMTTWLEDAVRFAKQEAKFPYVFLTTNGSLAKPQRLRRCFINGLDSLKFSLNYADRDQFVDVAQADERLFDIMLNNIKDAYSERNKVYNATGHHCGLYASYIDYDDEQGEKMKELIAELEPYLDEIYALPLYNQASLVTGEANSRDWSIRAGNPGRLDAMREPLPCWAVFTEGHITWDGKLSACCFDHDGKFHMGDLTNESFLFAWNSEKFQELRAAHLKRDVTGTVCENCIAYQ